ncbi:hypothetical protein CDD83_9288 [Cordyceps sp. RAO-2017]|nr:hypothetical protein CDD83_9288 [Cordyceps sp. RAO-2017]
MKRPGSVTAVTTAVLLGFAAAFPSLEELAGRVERRASTELIGDLATLGDGDLTRTGKDIKAILQAQAPGFDAGSTFSGANSTGCGRGGGDGDDPCCIWKRIADEMREAMVGSAGRCNNVARAAVRLGFHDAASWSKSTGPGGGADGSIVLAGECESRSENNGLQDICGQMRRWFDKYRGHNVSMADLIQTAANVGTVVCPLGPRVRTFVGRRDSDRPAPEGLIPLPSQGADELIALFADKTIAADGLVALVGAHSSAQQRFVAPNRSGDPLDSTPGVWDTNFYGEVLDANAPRRVFKLQSDVSLSKDPRTSATWQAFVGTRGQGPWDGAYSREYVRLSLLGVDNINSLTECTKVLPPFIPTFTNPDEPRLNQYLTGDTPVPESNTLMDGNRLGD